MFYRKKSSPFSDIFFELITKQTHDVQMSSKVLKRRMYQLSTKGSVELKIGDRAQRN